jgi:hypothetical protein
MPASEQRLSPLHEAIKRAENGAALYVWRVDADSAWRITDWAGVPEPPNSLSDLGRVDLFGPSGVARSLSQSTPEGEG